MLLILWARATQPLVKQLEPEQIVGEIQAIENGPKVANDCHSIAHVASASRCSASERKRDGAKFIAHTWIERYELVF